ncbi:MAG: ECF transporter S component [Clostridia bacterium]|nr:ECF transporter S component [Clostridia bacterium]MBQ3869276.1 ECF transporter S component [Clostridia bacterium]
MKKSLSKKQIRTLVLYAVLIAIEAIFCFTPLGSLPLGGPIVATLAMIPVCITGVLLGVRAGTILGFTAGLFSFIVWTFITPGAMSLVFTPFFHMEVGGVNLGGSLWTLVICFVPRILTGTVSGLIYKAMTSKAEDGKKKYFAAALAGVAGSVVNTVGVLGGVALFLYRDFGLAIQSFYEAGYVTYSTVWGFIGFTLLTNSIAEAVVTGLVTPATVPLKKLLDGKVS